MRPSILSVRNLTKRYKGVTAVNDVSFEVERGSITGLIGPNGSGKSTTIDCMSGFQRVDSGNWSVDGTELAGLSADAHALAGLTRTFQTVRTYKSFTLEQNLLAAAQEHQKVGWWACFTGGSQVEALEAAARKRAHELLHLVGLSAYAQAPAAVLSYGQRKLLAIAATMMPDPKLVILDEPVSGINPTMILRVEGTIRRLNARGTTILVVEHNMDFIMRLCQRVIVLVEGRLLVDGPPASVQTDPRVLDAYLGQSHVAVPA